MLRLIQKFSIMFVFYMGLYVVVLFPLLNYDRITSPDTEDPSYIFYQGIFLIWAVLGALWAHENLEHKTNGYRFLQTLPLSGQKIIGAKFVLVYVNTAVFVIYQSFMLRILTGNARLAAASWAYMAVLSSLCLVVAGLAYVGIYRFGFLRFGKVLLGLWLLLFLSPIAIREFIFPPLGLSIDDVLRFVIGLNWLVVCLIGTAVFWGLLPLAARLKLRGTDLR